MPSPTLDVAQVDPCLLVDPGELSTAVHAELPTGVPLPDIDGQSACSYDVPEMSTSVLILVDRAPASSDQGTEIVGQLPLDGRAEELHGVGEVAWFDYCPSCPDSSATTLSVIEPPLSFTIALSLPASDEVRRIILEQLARNLIERMGL